MKRKVLATILALATVGMLAGCGGSSADKAAEPAKEETPAAEAETPAAETDAAGGDTADVDYPTKPITVIVPAGAGGDTDLNTRIFCKYLGDELGQTIVVNNIKGTAAALEEFKAADSDGYTVMAWHPGFFSATGLGTVDGAWSDFKVAGVMSIDQQSAWFVNNNSPWQTLDDLVADAKKSPVGFATEVGSMSHIGELMFMDLAEGVQFNIVDAGGSADKITALMGGQLDLMYNNVGLVQDYMANGDFRCLGIMAEERSEFNPDIPTFKEQGYDLIFDKPYWLFFPAEADDAIVAKFQAAMEKVYANQECIDELAESMQTVPGNLIGADAEAYLKAIDDSYQEAIASMQQ